jgi:hypothetical protein
VCSLITVFALAAGAGGIAFLAAPWAGSPDSPYLQPSLSACLRGSAVFAATNLSAAFVDCAAFRPAI